MGGDSKSDTQMTRELTVVQWVERTLSTITSVFRRHFGVLAGRRDHTDTTLVAWPIAVVANGGDEAVVQQPVGNGGGDNRVA